MDKLKRLSIVLSIISSVIPIYYYGKLTHYIFNMPIHMIPAAFVTGLVAIFCTIIISYILYQIVKFIYMIFRYINKGYWY